MSTLPLTNLIGPSALGIFGGDLNFSLRYGGYWPPDRINLPNRAPIGFFSEPQLWAAISWSRFLCERNVLAIGFIENLINFIGDANIEFHINENYSKIGEKTKKLLEDVNYLFNEFCYNNSWGQRKGQWRKAAAFNRDRESRRRWIRDGEVWVRFFVQDRKVIIRFIEPEQIRTPAIQETENYDNSWGITTLKNDVETVIGYWVYYPFNPELDKFEFVKPLSIVSLKANTDITIKRGLPDLTPIEVDLQLTSNIIRNLQQTSKAQSAIAWIEKYSTAHADQIRKLIADTSSLLSHQISPLPVGLGHSTETIPVQYNPGGTVLTTNDTKEFVPGPTSDSKSYIEIVQQSLRSIGWRWAYPDWFTEGANTYASALVVGSPFTRAIQAKQEEYSCFLSNLAYTTIKLYELIDKLPDGATKIIHPVITFPPIFIADESKQISTWKTELDTKVMDPIEWMHKRGRNPKDVFKNMKKWAKLMKVIDKIENPQKYEKRKSEEGKQSKESKSSSKQERESRSSSKQEKEPEPSPPGKKLSEQFINIKEKNPEKCQVLKPDGEKIELTPQVYCRFKKDKQWESPNCVCRSDKDPSESSNDKKSAKPKKEPGGTPSIPSSPRDKKKSSESEVKVLTGDYLRDTLRNILYSGVNSLEGINEQDKTILNEYINSIKTKEVDIILAHLIDLSLGNLIQNRLDIFKPDSSWVKNQPQQDGSNGQQILSTLVNNLFNSILGKNGGNTQTNQTSSREKIKFRDVNESTINVLNTMRTQFIQKIDEIINPQDSNQDEITNTQDNNQGGQESHEKARRILRILLKQLEKHDKMKHNTSLLYLKSTISARLATALLDEIDKKLSKRETLLEDKVRFLGKILISTVGNVHTLKNLLEQVDKQRELGEDKDKLKQLIWRVLSNPSIDVTHLSREINFTNIGEIAKFIEQKFSKRYSTLVELYSNNNENDKKFTAIVEVIRACVTSSYLGAIVPKLFEKFVNVLFGEKNSKAYTSTNYPLFDNCIRILSKDMGEFIYVLVSDKTTSGISITHDAHKVEFGEKERKFNRYLVEGLNLLFSNNTNIVKKILEDPKIRLKIDNNSVCNLPIEALTDGILPQKKSSAGNNQNTQQQVSTNNQGQSIDETKPNTLLRIFNVSEMEKLAKISGSIPKDFIEIEIQNQRNQTEKIFVHKVLVETVLTMYDIEKQLNESGVTIDDFTKNISNAIKAGKLQFLPSVAECNTPFSNDEANDSGFTFSLGYGLGLVGSNRKKLENKLQINAESDFKFDNIQFSPDHNRIHITLEGFTKMLEDNVSINNFIGFLQSAFITEIKRRFMKRSNNRNSGQEEATKQQQEKPSET